MGSFFFGYQASVTNLSFNTLKFEYGISNDPNIEEYRGNFNLAMAIGAGIAALSFNSILKVIGRR